MRSALSALKKEPTVTVKDAQVRKVMEEMTKHGQLGLAALRAGVDRKTARKYVQAGRHPSELKKPRGYLTRADPFEADWTWLEEQMKALPGLEAKILFEALQARRPGRYLDGQLRTLQRRMKRWRAEHGPDREVFFRQQHRPGEAMQVDFTDAAELGVTVAGVEFPHLLCHPVFPYSNWEEVTVCLSESFLALRRGIQDAVFRIGRVPGFVQTDNTTAATHQVASGGREFNEDYEKFIKYLGMTPRTIEVGKKEQNGDVEAANGALKRRLKQELLLRGTTDFESVEAYEAWLVKVVGRRNRGRRTRFNEELAVMSKVAVRRLVEFIEADVRVSGGSTIRIKYCTYSVPSKLIGERVRVRIFDRHLEVFYGGGLQFSIERVRGQKRHRINYRHVIWSLVQKPGAFARYQYREEMFPSLAFRRAYDANAAAQPNVRGDLEYLRLLHLAAATIEADVESAILQLLDAELCPTADLVKKLLGEADVEVPVIEPFDPELDSFDALLSEVAQ